MRNAGEDVAFRRFCAVALLEHEFLPAQERVRVCLVEFLDLIRHKKYD